MLLCEIVMDSSVDERIRSAAARALGRYDSDGQGWLWRILIKRDNESVPVQYGALRYLIYEYQNRKIELDKDDYTPEWAVFEANPAPYLSRWRMLLAQEE